MVYKQCNMLVICVLCIVVKVVLDTFRFNEARDLILGR